MEQATGSDRKMRNTVLLSTWQTWNDFTSELKRLCIEQGNKVLVTLRDGTVAQVGFFPADEAEGSDDGFRDLNVQGSRRWSPSGQCFTTRDWDMIELVAIEQNLTIGKLSEQQSVDAEKEYAFDLQLAAAVRVRAKSQAQAEELVREMLETANCNAGCWPNGAPFNFEASVDGGLSLFEIDGVDVNAS